MILNLFVLLRTTELSLLFPVPGFRKKMCSIIRNLNINSRKRTERHASEKLLQKLKWN